MFKPNQKLVFYDFETTGLDVCNQPTIGCLPIELSMIMTDNELNIIGKPFFSELILWDELKSFVQAEWENSPAYKVNNISLYEINKYGVGPKYIPKLIQDFLKNCTFTKKEQIILISDNPYFDNSLLQKLYNCCEDNIKYPFHYNCFSPIMLYSAIGLNIRRNKKHRALDDVYDMYKSCVIAFDRIKYFDYKRDQ